MGLKAVVATLDNVAEDQRLYYTQGDDGKFYLEIDGIEEHPGALALKRALDAEREARRRAARKSEALRSSVERQAKGESTRDGAGNGAVGPDGSRPSGPVQVDAAIRAYVEDRLARLDESRQQEASALREAYEVAEGSARTTREQLNRERLENLILRAATEAGVRRAALPDVLARARETWSLDGDGNPVAYQGGKRIIGPDGEAPLALEAWLGALAQNAPHLFEPNHGGAAAGLQAVLATHEMLVDQTRPNAIGENLEAFARGEARIT